LPGSHAYEWSLVLQKGYTVEKIFSVEMNLAIKANFTRRVAGAHLPQPTQFLRMPLSDAVHDKAYRALGHSLIQTAGIRAALHGRFLNVLITDEDTALALVGSRQA